MDPISFLKRQWTSIPQPTAPFTGQTIIVTGSNIGLGLEAARHYVSLGAAKVILAVRTRSKGEEAAADIARTTGLPNVCEVWELDMADFESVKAFGKRAAGLGRLDAVLENAGIATRKYVKTNEGFEQTIAVNVVGTFLLALNLLPILRATARKFNTVPRLSIVCSDVHFMAKFNERNSTPIFDALSINDSTNMADRYNTSKLLDVLLTRQLASLTSGPNSQPQVIINTPQPGLCHSSLTREADGIIAVILYVLKGIFARTTEVGARTLIAGSSAGEESHGAYMSEGHVETPSAFVRSEEGKKTQERVWEELIGILESIQPGVSKNI